MNRNHVPSLDGCLTELLQEEQHIVTPVAMGHRANDNAPVHVAYVAQRANT